MAGVTQLVTGPCLVYVLTNDDISTWKFLGTCERSPVIQLMQPEEGSMNSLGGVSLPFDRFYQGQEAIIAASINRIDYSVMRLLRRAPFYGESRLSAPLGTNSYLDLGAGMNKNGAAFQLCLKNLFAGTVNDPGNDLPAGYWFYSCFLEQDGQNDMVTVPQKNEMAFHAVREYQPFNSTGSLTTPGGMALYTETIPVNLPSPG